MSLFTTKHKRFSLTTLQQLFFRKLLIYFIRDVASVCSCHNIIYKFISSMKVSANILTQIGIRVRVLQYRATVADERARATARNKYGGRENP